MTRSGSYNKPTAIILTAFWVYSYAILLAIFSVLRSFEKKQPGHK